MTDKQPEALRLADQLERMSLSTPWDKKAAAELRRLHEVNKELFNEVGVLCSQLLGMRMEFGEGTTMQNLDAALHAEAALVKAIGESND